MAKESSFDIVSSVDMQEVDNAYGQAKKELAQRYDLKDSGSSIDLDKAKKTLTIVAPADFVVGQIKDIISSKLFKRGIDMTAVKWGNNENASGGMVRCVGSIVEGILPQTCTIPPGRRPATSFSSRTVSRPLTSRKIFGPTNSTTPLGSA